MVKKNTEQYKLNDDGSFVIENYSKAFPFANFLPGIAGVWGVPLWVFSVNRAQAVMGFGLADKDHAITEFYPANKAYSLVSNLGFRTFIKINNKQNYEPFSSLVPFRRKERMIIRSESLEIVDENIDLGIRTRVKYFGLPNASVAGLLRIVDFENLSGRKMDIEVLDGLPRIIPFGSNHFMVKELARTLEAWMHAFTEKNLSLFNLVVDPGDVSETKYIEGANFHCSFFQDNDRRVLPVMVVDPDVIFAEDKSYAKALRFESGEFSVRDSQIMCGKTPCSFAHFKTELKTSDKKTLYNVFGASPKVALIKKYVSRFTVSEIKKKEKENGQIVSDIKENALCLCGDNTLSNYIQNTYLDNVLRGGYPLKLDGSDVYYVYSRKHGDLERDYNRFKLIPSCFSEGEANYRDINQNRRQDLFFNPFIGESNLTYFLNLIKINGYNPLIVQGEKLGFSGTLALTILKEYGLEKEDALITLMKSGFYLGEFFNYLNEHQISVDGESLAKRLLKSAERLPQASFGEGYWVDHWRYNLDLLESYLDYYPDKLSDLFTNKKFMFWDDDVLVKPRADRYCLRGGKVYQGESIEHDSEKKAVLSKRTKSKNFLRTKTGKIYYTNLVEKLLTLILNKSATLDPDGIGVEMEAGKPGWCDSLNGLPALFGSSLCETLAIKRTALFLRDALLKLSELDEESVSLSSEVSRFLKDMTKLLVSASSSKTKNKDFLWWDRSNSIKETFRKNTFFHLNGEEKTVDIKTVIAFLDKLIVKLNAGIKRGKDKKSAVFNTYFTYTATVFRQSQSAIYPKSFKRHALPLFLEAPVSALSVEKNKSDYNAVKRSVLFDKTLKMYRLNASLKSEPLEIGRSRVFVPGWLENESIWLHMEYKYLLETLKVGLYDDFYEDFFKVCVCFFDPARYGRNILENSSFIASSAYPDKTFWGKGFVARLSGATAEFLNIWILLCLGKKPFFIDTNRGLCFKVDPILKASLFTTKKSTVIVGGKPVVLDKNTFSYKLFSHTLVVYHNPNRRDTFPSRSKTKPATIEKIVLTVDGKKQTVNASVISSPLSYRVRRAEVERIDVYFK